MKNKLLTIGSITAVVVLILAGLSPVVGFDSVRSSKINSPLFNLRTQRAIDKGQNIQTCTYLGIGRTTDILFPTRDNNSMMTWKIINSISTMSEEEFDKFICLVTYKSNELKDEDTQELRVALHQLKDNPEGIMYFLNDDRDNRLATEGCPVPTFFEPLPDCFWNILLVLFVGVITIIGTIGMVFKFIFRVIDEIKTMVFCN